VIRKLLVVLALLAALALAACGQGSVEEGLAVEDAWVRPSPMAQGNGAGYMVITNNTGQDDALLGAGADFAESVEIHETVAMEDDMMAMHHVERIDIPAGESVSLEPGGYHVMLIGVTEALREGDTVTLTLNFENAGEMTIEAPVREE
jgi:copper(I)-binding protein